MEDNTHSQQDTDPKHDIHCMHGQTILDLYTSFRWSVGGGGISGALQMWRSQCGLLKYTTSDATNPRVQYFSIYYTVDLFDDRLHRILNLERFSISWLPAHREVLRLQQICKLSILTLIRFKKNLLLWLCGVRDPARIPLFFFKETVILNYRCKTLT